MDFIQYMLDNAIEGYNELSADYEELEGAYDELAGLFDELLDEYTEVNELADEAFNAYTSLLLETAEERNDVDAYIEEIKYKHDEVVNRYESEARYLRAKVRLLEEQLKTSNQALDWYREQPPITCKSDFNPWCD